jgi:hypothetical protein
LSSKLLEGRSVSEEVYDHLPRWRRIVHDLAVEAGLKKFVKPSDSDIGKSSGSSDSSASENQPDGTESAT